MFAGPPLRSRQVSCACLYPLGPKAVGRKLLSESLEESRKGGRGL